MSTKPNNLNKDVSVSNLVFTCNLGQRIDPFLVCHALGGKVGAKFPSCFVKIKKPKMTLSIFRTGSIIATGCPSVEAAVEAFYTTISKLSEACGKPFFFFDFKIVLLVCSTKLKYKLNLYLLHKYFGLSAQWTPENFPGVKIELPFKSWTLVAFDSGTIIVTGFSSFEEVPQAIEMIETKLDLKRFAKDRELFTEQEINESKEFEARRSKLKRGSHLSKNDSIHEITGTVKRVTKPAKDSKSHTRFRKEDNSMIFTMNSSYKHKMTTVHSSRMKRNGVKPY